MCPSPAAGPTVGMVGAGQLARMTHQAAVDLDIDLVVLARSAEEPAVRAGARHLVGEPDDPDAVTQLARLSRVLTFDHEQVPNQLLCRLGEQGHRVQPHAGALRAAQDKLTGRRVFRDAGLPVPAFAGLGPDARQGVTAFADRYGWPVVLKARSGGYDGRGVAVVANPGDLGSALARMGTTGLLVEAYVPIALELAVLGVRSPSGSWAVYPPVATMQVEGICRELVMPAPVSPGLAAESQALARRVAGALDACGIVAVELFVDTAGQLVVNEIALRPHNSGHATIEGAVTSQFHNHLRAVLDWPLGDTALRAPAAATVNVLGPPHGPDPRSRLTSALAVPGAAVHLYSKAPYPGRKLGHVTALGHTAEEALGTARHAASLLVAGT